MVNEMHEFFEMPILTVSKRVCVVFNVCLNAFTKYDLY